MLEKQEISCSLPRVSYDIRIELFNIDKGLAGNWVNSISVLKIKAVHSWLDELGKVMRASSLIKVTGSLCFIAPPTLTILISLYGATVSWWHIIPVFEIWMDCREAVGMCVPVLFFVVCVCILESSLLIHASLPFCQSVFGTGAGLTLSNGRFFPRVPFLVWSGARFCPPGFPIITTLKGHNGQWCDARFVSV